MKKLFSIIGLIGLATPLLAAKISDSQLELGKESSTDNKEILFNIGEGTGNPKIRANYGTKKLEFTNDGNNFLELGSGGESGAYNIIDNAGFESDLTNWTNIGSGSLSVDTDAADVYQGQKSALWDAAAAADILASEAVTIPGGLRGNLCSVEVQYKGGDDNLKLQAYDGTNVLAEVALEASANFAKAMVTFTCPNSGTLQGRLIASADAAAVNLDNFVVGKSSDILTALDRKVYSTNCDNMTTLTNNIWTDANCSLYLPAGLYSMRISGSARVGFSSAPTYAKGSLLISPTSGNGNQTATSPQIGGNVLTLSTDDSPAESTMYFKKDVNWAGGFIYAFGIIDVNGGTSITRQIRNLSMSATLLDEEVGNVQRVETSAWHVNARLLSSPEFDMIGATTTERIVSSSTGVINNNYGSIDAQIMCNGAAPTGTTCSGVNELPGIAFDAPRAGPAYVCVRGIFYASEQSANTDFSPALTLHRVATDGSVSAGNLGTTWSSLELINLQQWRFELEAGLVTTNHDVASPYYLCGIANLTAGKNGFVVASESAYAQGVPTEMDFSAVRWNVFPIEQQLPQALLISPEPAGEVASFAMNTCPAGWLKADGSAVNRTANSRLFDAIGTTFGVGDGSTTFNLPDMRGEFVRGFDDGRGVDSGRVFGSAQADELDSHSHVLRAREWSGSGSTDFGGTLDFRPRAATGGVDLSGINGTGVSSQDTSTTATGGSETRPRNVALLYCIRK